MAGWGNKTPTAEEILGMKPEDLRSRLDGAATKDDLKALKDAQEASQSSLDEIRNSLRQLTTPPPPPDPTLKADQDDPTTQVLTDPSGFISRQMQPLAEQSLATRAELMEMRARTEFAGMFQKYGKELLESAAKFPLTQRAQPTFWGFHIRTTIGDKALKGEIEAESYPSLIGGSSFAPPNAGPERDPNNGLDPAVVDYLKSRGIPAAEAAAIHNLNKNGEPIDIEQWRKIKPNAA